MERPEPASFRDAAARIFYGEDGSVLRALSETAVAEWRSLEATRFFGRLSGEGRIVGTELVEGARVDGYPVVLRHRRIPFVSYPYEWTFGMLKDAALLQLDLVEAALAEGMTLKDASPYNVQWHG